MMKMSELIEKLKIVKYKIDKFVLYIEDYGEYEVETQYIGSIIIEKNYDGFNFPFFEVLLSVPNKVFRAMRKKNIQINAYIRMKYTTLPRDETASERSTKQKQNMEYVEFAKNFHVYGLDGSPTIDEDQQEAIEKAMQEDTDDAVDPTNATTLYLLLYDLENLRNVKKIINEVITSGTLTDIITRVFNATGIKHVLMSPETNGKTYSEFTLLPIRTDAQIERICNDYGMHENGTRIFYDFNTVFVINKKIECTAWRKGEYKQTYIIYNPAPVKSSDSAVMKTTGCYEDPEDEINYCTMFSCNMTTPNVFADQAYGTSYLALDSKTGELREAMSDSLTANNEKSTISKVLTTNRGNSDTISEMVQSNNNDNVVFQCVIDNVKLDFLSLNKEFHLIFNDNKLSKYNGKYRIRNFITSFNRTDGDWFTTNTVVTFSGKRNVQ